MPRPMRPPSSRLPWWPAILLVAIIIALFGAWQAGLFGDDDDVLVMRDIPPRPITQPDSTAAGAGEGSPEPAAGNADETTIAAADAGENPADETSPAAEPAGPHYLVRELDAQARRDEPLPRPGAASDAPLAQALGAIGDRSTITEYFNLQEIVRRFVITVDNLPRRIVPSQQTILRRIPGVLAVRPADDGQFELMGANALRYHAFLRFAEAVDPELLVRLYVRFYPLLQYEYQQLGYPDGYFNDRLVAAIDDMLAAPPTPDPVLLVQPKVLYRFADPALEALSAGQKIMVRIGPENAARLRAILVRLRERFTQLEQ